MKQRRQKDKTKKSSSDLLDTFQTPQWSEEVLWERNDWVNGHARCGYDDEELLLFLLDYKQGNRWRRSYKEAAFITGLDISFVRDVYEWFDGWFGGCELTFPAYKRLKRTISTWTLATLLRKSIPCHATLRNLARDRITREGVGIDDVVRELTDAGIPGVSAESILRLLRGKRVAYTDLPPALPFRIEDRRSKSSNYYMHPRGLRVLERIKRFARVRTQTKWLEMSNKAKSMRVRNLSSIPTPPRKP